MTYTLEQKYQRLKSLQNKTTEYGRSPCRLDDYLAAAPEMMALIEEYREDNERLFTSAALAWNLLNSIRAREGVPHMLDHTQQGFKTEYMQREAFDKLVDDLDKVVGGIEGYWKACKTLKDTKEIV